MSSRDASETYRALHSTIKYAAGERPIRSVLIVDADRPQVSEVAANIATAFARAGDACAFVDANFRASSSDQPGLSDIIRDHETALTADVNGDRLAHIGPGRGADPDLLASGRMAGAVESLLSRYDYLVVSCPPLPEHGDAVAIAPHVDASILVISAGVTRREEAIRARDALERVGSRILGMVMIERPRRWF